jgi:pantoate kinase
VVRIRPGAPGVGEAVGYTCPPLAAVTVHTKRIETAAMLRDLRTALEVEGRKAVEQTIDGDFYSFLETARRFSIAVGFLSKELDAELVKLKGAVGHYAKKGVLVVIAERDCADDVAERLRRLGPVKICELKSRAVSLL